MAQRRKFSNGDQRDNLRAVFTALRSGHDQVRRGDVRPAMLAMLRESPMHGYQLMTELEARTGGRWRPSAGSVYPTLQQLEDEGIVTSAEQDGRRVYTLTEKGRKVANESTLVAHPWFGRHAGHGAVDLRRQAVQLIAAAVQVEKVGSDDARRQAREMLAKTRRRLYAILAEDDPASHADEEKEEVQ
jgi:DNA-binding PadR family transcriptional regulator